MAKGHEVLEMLIPQGGWTIAGDDFDSINFIDCEPITKKQFLDSFALVDEWKIQEEITRADKKTALLAKLGITEDEAKLLLS